MPSNLDTLRRINALAMNVRPLDPVDADLAAEAGMDGNYARLLQAARELDLARLRWVRDNVDLDLDTP